MVAARARDDGAAARRASGSRSTADRAPPPSGPGPSSTGSPRCARWRHRGRRDRALRAGRDRAVPRPVRRRCDAVCDLDVDGYAARRSRPIEGNRGSPARTARRVGDLRAFPAPGIVRIRMTAVPARPLIGLTGRRKRGADVAGFPDSLADVDLDVYVSDYAEAITAAGGLPVHLPQHVDPAEYAGRLDGLLLSGGADVDPVRYGADAETGHRTGRGRARRRRARPDRRGRRRRAAGARHLPRPAAAQRVGRRHAAPGRAGARPLRRRRRRRVRRGGDRAGLAARRAVRRAASASTRCTTRPSTGSPTDGSSRRAAATARSRRWSGRATTSSPCSGTPSCSPARRPTRCSRGSSSGRGPGRWPPAV